jgi:hypothetical protein
MKKISVILVFLSSLLFVYSSCKDEDDNNNSNIDLYSSKDMEGTYIYQWDCDCDSLNYASGGWLHVQSVAKDSLVLERIGSSYSQSSTMYKEGRNFYERNVSVYGSLWEPYRIKGIIRYVNSGNPYLSDHYYEISGVYCSDTNLTDTIGTFCAKQINHEPYGWPTSN